MTRDPELQATIDKANLEESLGAAKAGLLTEQVAMLGELGTLVKRHAYLDQLARRHPNLDTLTRAAQLAKAAVTEARYLETKLSDAYAEVIEALTEIKQADR